MATEPLIETDSGRQQGLFEKPESPEASKRAATGGDIGLKTVGEAAVLAGRIQEDMKDLQLKGTVLCFIHTNPSFL